MEYTPYGELWVEHGPQGFEAVPYRFTGKELDQETGLYYYGARYLNPRTSRWISPDQGIQDYLPIAPISQEARRRNSDLPGVGGVFNLVNLSIYQYGGNSPAKIVDPDGAIIMTIPSLYKMNQGVWRSDKTGYFAEGRTLKETGCAVAVMSNIVSAATGSGISPRDINNQKQNFVLNTDKLKMQQVGEAKGLAFDYWTAARTDLISKLADMDASPKEFFIAAQVKYNAAGDSHWVGVSGIAQFEGKTYIEVSASSIRDIIKEARPRATWRLESGKMYVEIKDIIKIYTFEQK